MAIKEPEWRGPGADHEDGTGVMPDGRCPCCGKLLVRFNDDYSRDGTNGWVKNSPDQWVCSNPECEKFFF
jgi:hypothetical protein